MPERTAAILQALFVTALWSSSWVLIKLGLAAISPLTFAGLRYFMAFLLLLLLWLRSPGRAERSAVIAKEWPGLFLLGLVMYALTQGAQFVSLAYLPAQSTSLILSFTPALVAGAAAIFLGERPHAVQLGGIGLSLIGALIFFTPLSSSARAMPLPGLWAACVGLFANAAASLLGRRINRSGRLGPLEVTTVSMGVGSAALIGSALFLEGIPSLSLSEWLIVGWLAVVNTAFAFTLWNRTLRTLTAAESSVINNTMTIQIALLAHFFLGEILSAVKASGLLLAAIGAFLVASYQGIPMRRRNTPVG